MSFADASKSKIDIKASFRSEEKTIYLSAIDEKGADSLGLLEYVNVEWRMEFRQSSRI